jgi:RNA polymerase primary sigma factor
MEKLLAQLRLVRREIIDKLDKALKSGQITPRERAIFYYRHIDWYSLEDCGRKFGVTRERIRQIEAKVMEKIRHETIT